MIPLLDELVRSGRITQDQADRVANWALRAQEPIGVIAVDYGLIVGPQVDEVLDRQHADGRRFGEICIEMNLLTRERLAVLLEIQRFRVTTSVIEVLALCELMPLDEAVAHYAKMVAAGNAGVASIPAQHA